MEIKKVMNYKSFGDNLASKTGLDVKIKVIDSYKEHYHYQLSKDGISLGILCYNEGNMSFAPFERLNGNFSNDCYIELTYAPSF